MDEKELVKVGVESALKPFANLIERLFGGSVDEIGGMWQDTVKARRIVRHAKLFKGVQEKLAKLGVEPQEVPDRISIPILQAASLEDDEYLQHHWAALLANAANPATAMSIQACFPHILGQLTRSDAVLLNAIYEHVRRGGHAPGKHQPEVPLNPLHAEQFAMDYVTLLSIFADAGLASSSWRELIETHGKPLSESSAIELTGFLVALANLRRLQLISTRIEMKVTVSYGGGGEGDPDESFYLTVLGCEFIKSVSQTPANPRIS